MARARQAFPAWATRFLRGLGYRPRPAMESWVRKWWAWFDASDEWYGVDSPECPRHMTLRPAKAVADEFEFLMLDGDTQISSPDEAVNAWLADRFGGIVPSLAGFVSQYMALGTGGLALDLSGVSVEPGVASPGAEAGITRYDAFHLAPLLCDGGECVSCAFEGRVVAGGRELDQLQVHEPGERGTYRVRTWLFETRSHDRPVEVEGVIPEVETGSPVPTFALATPAIANTCEDDTPMGVSCYADALDAVKAVDEAFDQYFWSVRLCRPRVFMDDSAIIRDPSTGRARFRDTVDQMLYEAVPGPIDGRQPITVYNPELRVEEHRQSISLALSLLGMKTGFGTSYFSFDGAQIQGSYKTAKEVVAGSARLMRTVRKHELSLGAALSRVLSAAWCCERGLRSGSGVGEAPRVDVTWDDSIMEDTETERQTMKDDIARGLCPAWLYPATYYGMSEEEARALTGEAAAAAEIPEEA